MRIAVDEINAFLLKHEMLIYLVVFDTAATKMGRDIYPDLKAYIDHNYVCDNLKDEFDYDAFIEESETALKERMHFHLVIKEMLSFLTT